MLKKIAAMIMALSLILSLAGCQSKQAEAPKEQPKQEEAKKEEPKKEPTSVERIKQAGKIVMATSADFPPYESIDPKDGKTIIGFDVDIAEAIAKKIGVKLEIKDTKFDGLVPALVAKSIDFVIAGMTPDEDRMKSVDFSQIYFKADQVVVVKDSDNTISKVTDMKGKKFGAQLGTTSEKAAKTVEGINLKTLDKVDQLCLQVKNGNLDGIVLEETVAAAYVKSMGGLKIVKMAELNEGPAGSAVAVQKGDAELLKVVNEVLDELKSSGEFDKLVNKWFIQ